MHLFSLERNQAVVLELDGEIVVRVLEINGDEVRLGIERPEGVSIQLGETAVALRQRACEPRIAHVSPGCPS